MVFGKYKFKAKTQQEYVSAIIELFAKTLSSAIPTGLMELIIKLLMVDPRKRWTAKEALQSEFFTSHPVLPTNMARYVLVYIMFVWYSNNCSLVRPYLGVVTPTYPVPTVAATPPVVAPVVVVPPAVVVPPVVVRPTVVVTPPVVVRPTVVVVQPVVVAPPVVATPVVVVQPVENRKKRTR
jgi:serine/threonine protein kinase